MSSGHETNSPTGAAPEYVNLPSPTLWPGLLALGLALVATGLVTSSKVTWVGASLTLVGCVGWFFQVLPREHHEEVRDRKSTRLNSSHLGISYAVFCLK